MKTYIYKGERNGSASSKLLVPGLTYTLDPEDPHVRSLVSQKLLEEVKVEKPKKTKKKQS